MGRRSSAQLADTWTRTCDAPEYVEFLTALFERLAHLRLTADGEQHYFWKGDGMISYDPKFDEMAPAVSYTHLTLPTICSV